MDLNDIRVIVTVVSFVTFIGIIVWAYSGRRRAAFDQAARSVLEEEDDVRNARRGDTA
jgi:cytochrome c oxidase cbb3-type subunit 4